MNKVEVVDVAADDCVVRKSVWAITTMPRIHSRRSTCSAEREGEKKNPPRDENKEKREKERNGICIFVKRERRKEIKMSIRV